MQVSGPNLVQAGSGSPKLYTAHREDRLPNATLDIAMAGHEQRKTSQRAKLGLWRMWPGEVFPEGQTRGNPEKL